MVEKTKSVTGIAHKVDDIRAFYERALKRVAQKGRMTEQGREYSQMISEMMEALNITEVPFQVIVEYIAEASDGKFDGKRLAPSVRAFLKSKAAKQSFETYLDGRTLMVRKV